MPYFADNSTKLIVLLEKYWFFCFKLEYNCYICATFININGSCRNFYYSKQRPCNKNNRFIDSFRSPVEPKQMNLSNAAYL